MTGLTYQTYKQNERQHSQEWGRRRKTGQITITHTRHWAERPSSTRICKQPQNESTSWAMKRLDGEVPTLVLKSDQVFIIPEGKYGVGEDNVMERLTSRSDVCSIRVVFFQSWSVVLVEEKCDFCLCKLYVSQKSNFGSMQGLSIP